MVVRALQQAECAMRRRPDPHAEGGHPPGKVSAQARGVGFEAPQVVNLTGPVELVALVAVEEVVFLGTLLQSGPDGETHDDLTDAQVGVPGIESRLVVVEARPEAKSVDGRG